MAGSRATRWLALLLLCFLATMPGRSQGAQPPRRVINVTAERFEFFPAQISVEQGEQIELRITSEDTLHGFRIVGAGVSVVVPKRGRGEAVAVFTAEKPGRYTFECNRMCGAGHNFMRGVLIVESPRAEDAQP